MPNKHRPKSRRPWAPWELEFLRRHYATTQNLVLARVLDRHISSVNNRGLKLGLRKDPAWIAETARQRALEPDHGGASTRFAKGNVPWSAGTKGRVGLHPNSRANHFKPGELNGSAAKRVQPIGAYRVNGEGLLELKFSDTPGPYTKRWRPVHRIVWEQAFGPIPDGHVVRFREGRRTTELALITPDALELVTHAENMRRNSVHTLLPPELARLAQLRGALNRQINARLKEQDRDASL